MPVSPVFSQTMKVHGQARKVPCGVCKGGNKPNPKMQCKNKKKAAKRNREKVKFCVFLKLNQETEKIVVARVVGCKPRKGQGEEVW